MPIQVPNHIRVLAGTLAGQYGNSWTMISQTILDSENVEVSPNTLKAWNDSQEPTFYTARTQQEEQLALSIQRQGGHKLIARATQVLTNDADRSRHLEDLLNQEIIEVNGLDKGSEDYYKVLNLKLTTIERLNKLVRTMSNVDVAVKLATSQPVEPPKEQPTWSNDDVPTKPITPQD